MIRFLLIGTLLIFVLGCTGTMVEENSEVHDMMATLKSAELPADQIGMVCGMLFEVEDYNQWSNEYSKISKGLIIALRNVDYPKMALVFEGLQDREEAENRIVTLSSKAFQEQTDCLGKPVSSLYQVEYFKPVPDPPVHFLGVSFVDDEANIDWTDYTVEHAGSFKEYGIEAAGIGSHPDNSGQVYILFRQADFVASRKLLNSPRKIDKFLDILKLPKNTLISYWVRASE